MTATGIKTRIKNNGTCMKDTMLEQITDNCFILLRKNGDTKFNIDSLITRIEY